MPQDFFAPSALTLLCSTVFFMIFSGVFVGKYMDDYGPRPLLALGTFLHVFGLMMASISKQYYQILLSQAVCSAIGSSMVFYPAFACVSIPPTPTSCPRHSGSLAMFAPSRAFFFFSDTVAG